MGKKASKRSAPSDPTPYSQAIEQAENVPVILPGIFTDTKKWASAYRILLVQGGSRAYGLDEATSDWDWRGVALAPLSWLIGFAPSDQERTAIRQTDTEDVVIHELRKFCWLALQANPNIWEIVFCRDESVVWATEAGMALRSLRSAFLSRRAYRTFVGYAAAQWRLLERKARQDRAVWEYDSKHAMHMMRLLQMGEEVLREGVVRVWRAADREALLAIRDRQYELQTLLQWYEEGMQRCRDAYAHTLLPEEPDRVRVEQWLMETYRRWVDGDQTLLRPIIQREGNYERGPGA